MDSNDNWAYFADVQFLVHTSPDQYHVGYGLLKAWQKNVVHCRQDVCFIPFLSTLQSVLL